MLTIPAARFIDRGKCGPVIAAAVGCNLLGLLGVSFSTAFVPLLIGVFGAGAGYILVLQALTAWIKNLYPDCLLYTSSRRVAAAAVGLPLGGRHLNGAEESRLCLQKRPRAVFRPGP